MAQAKSRRGFAEYMTADKRLHLLAVEAIQSARRSTERALPKFVGMIGEDPDMILELVGREKLRMLALSYLMETLQRDMDGGGIGLRAVENAASNAVVEGAGHILDDLQTRVARPSAPQSQTPAVGLVGGGYDDGDIHHALASPPSETGGSKSDISQKLSKPTWMNKPAVSFADRVKAESRYARTVLDTFMLRGRPIGEWTHEELASVAETTARENRIAETFKRITPAGGRVRDYVKAEDAEAAVRSVELANAS